MWQEAELSLSAPQGDVELDRCTPPPQDVTSLGVIGGPCALKSARAVAAKGSSSTSSAPASTPMRALMALNSPAPLGFDLRWPSFLASSQQVMPSPGRRCRLLTLIVVLWLCAPGARLRAR